MTKRTNLALHDILKQVVRDLDTGCSQVTVKRAAEHSMEIRFMPDKTIERGYRISARHWIDQTPTIPVPTPTSARGTVGPYVGYSMWSAFIGFSVDSILATDWRFVA